MANQRMMHREPAGIRTIKTVDDGVISIIDIALSEGTVTGINENIITANNASESFISVPTSLNQGLLYYEVTGVSSAASGFLTGYSLVQAFAPTAGDQIEDVVYRNSDNRVLEDSVIISSTGVGGPISGGETLGVYWDTDAAMLVGVNSDGLPNFNSRGYSADVNKYNQAMYALIQLNAATQVAKVNLGETGFVHTPIASARSFLGTQVNNEVKLSPIHINYPENTLDASELQVTANLVAPDAVSCGSKPRNDGIRQFECANITPSASKRFGLVEAKSVSGHLGAFTQLGNLVGSIGYSPVTGQIFLGNAVVDTFVTNNGVGAITALLLDSIANTFQVRVGPSTSNAIAIPSGRYYPAVSHNLGGVTGFNFGASAFTHGVVLPQKSWAAV